MTDDIESYWEGLRPPRKPGKDPPKGSVCDHIDPTKIEGYHISEDALYLLEDPVDGATASDYQGESCVVFRPRWYKLHRWVWWLFITGGLLSSYEWTFTVIDLKVHKAYRRRREWPG
jgi:hypothetical protein